MTNSELSFTTAADARERLDILYAEQTAATRYGVPNDLYWSQLQEEIDATHAAYVGAAVTEIATLRGQLSGRQEG
jgi:septum formation topological specificity factor MinE